MFVLAIDLAPIDGTSECAIWRFDHDHKSAEDRWCGLYARLGKVVLIGEKRVIVLGVRLYETTSADRATARALVQAGEAKALLDSDNPLATLSASRSPCATPHTGAEHLRLNAFA
jgi:hypothetical protein